MKMMMMLVLAILMTGCIKQAKLTDEQIQFINDCKSKAMTSVVFVDSTFDDVMKIECKSEIRRKT